MCKSASKLYELGKGMFLGVDQSGMQGDKTCLCFARCKDKAVFVEKVEIIEQQEDIDKFINSNMKEIYGVFGIKEELISRSRYK